VEGHKRTEPIMPDLIFWTTATAHEFKSVVNRVMVSAKNKPPNRVVVDLEEVDPGDVVLAMGKYPLEVLQQSGVVPKNRSITSLRNKALPLMDSGAVALLTFDPSSVTYDYGLLTEIECDVRLALRLMATGTLAPTTGTYEWVDDFTDLCRYVDAKYRETGERVELSVDTETMGLYPWYPDKHIVSIAFSVEEGYSDVLDCRPSAVSSQLIAHKGRLWEQILWLLNSPKVRVRGANFKYDAGWLMEKWGMSCRSFTADTFLIGSLLDENRSNSLNLHAKVYTTCGGYDDIFNTKYDKGHMELIPGNDLVEYAGGDTDAALRVARELLKELKWDIALEEFYRIILHPTARAFEAVERRGVLIDMAAFDALHEKLDDTLADLEEQMWELVPTRVKQKHIEDLKFKPSLLSDLFFTKAGWGLTPQMFTAKPDKDGVPRPSTAKSHFEMFEDHPKAGEFVALKNEHGSATKTLQTYVIGFLKHLRPDGRFHPTYNFGKGPMHEKGGGADAGTVTGRLSNKGPALQTLPSHTKWAKRLRQCYPAPPGCLFFNADYDQGELRIAADVANESTMLDEYNKGTHADLHALTAATVSGYTVEDFAALKIDMPAKWKELRQKAKAVNFGLIYTMSAFGLMMYAKIGYGVEMTLDEAKAIHAAFFALYYKLKPWHTRYRHLAHVDGQVRNPLGRLRHLPLIKSSDQEVVSRAERQAINSPIQGGLSDMCLWSVALAERYITPHAPLQIIGATHDNIYGYVPEKEAVSILAELIGIMEHLPFHELPEASEWGRRPVRLPFPVEVSVGPTMGDLEVLDLAA